MHWLGGHRGVWLAAGLWAVAAPLNVALVAATIAPPGATHTPVAPDGPRVAGPVLPGDDAPPPGTVRDDGAGPSPAGPPPVKMRARARSEVRTVVHKVASGDGLISIARGYLGSGSRWREIAEANEIPRPYVLEPGASLRIPMARSARTEARLELFPPSDRAPATAPPAATPAVPVGDVNLSPPPTFEHLNERLLLTRPLAEAYPWRIPLRASLAFAGVAVVAAALALAGTKRRLSPARAARSLLWGTVAAGGACALLAGMATLSGAPVARSVVMQFLLAAATGGGAGASAWFAAKSTPGAEERDSPGHALAVRFGTAMGWLAASAVAAASMAGWLSRALMALRLGA